MESVMGSYISCCAGLLMAMQQKKKKKQQPRLSDETKIDKHELLSASFRQSVGHRDQKMAGWVCDWSPNKLHLRMQTEFENVFTFYL